MSTVHEEVLALPRRWRDEIDSEAPVVPLDLTALRARQRGDQARFLSLAHEVCEIRDTALRARTARLPIETGAVQQPAACPPACISRRPLPLSRRWQP